MNLITHPKRPSLSQFRSAKKRKNTERFEAGQITKWIQRQYLKIVFLLLFAYPLQVLRELTQFKKYIYEHS